MKRTFYLILATLLGAVPASPTFGAGFSLSLRNDDTGLTFARADGRIVLSSVTDNASGHQFLRPAAKPGLWKIELRPPDGKEADAVTLDEADMPCPIHAGSKDGKLITLTWNGLSAGPETNAVDVVVTVAAVKGGSLTDWRISVRNRCKNHGLWEVTFPRYEGLYVGKEGQACLPSGMGQVCDDPAHNPRFAFNDLYPSCLYAMQFASLSEGGSCLYLATQDPLAYLKRMRFERMKDGQGLLYEITQLPENMGVPGVNYKQSYPCILGAIPGDWVNAAKLYRKWVLANSAWMKGKKPLAQRTDLPESVKRLPYWMGFHGMTDDAKNQIIANIKYMGVPTAVHMYHWHQIPFDHRYPDFWPPWPQTFDYVKELHSMGAKVMPYINLHLMDTLCDSWKTDGAERFAVRLPDGSMKAEIDDDNRHMMPMCPGTTYWQSKFDPLVAQIVRDLDMDAIYCDQVAAIVPTPCFDKTHGHPVGGGHSWASGYKQMLANMRKSAASAKKDVFFTTESAAEPYDFDVYLRCNEGAPFLTPVWQMVYSGYRLSYGFYFYEQPEWVVKFATQYLWGVQIGWAGQHEPTKNPEDSAFEREVARARYAASDYLALGEMLRDPVLTGDFARVKTNWRNFGSQIPIDWPAVKGSLWKAPSGSIGLALVNMHTATQKVTFTLDRKEIGFGGGPVKLRALYPTELLADVKLTGPTLTQQIDLPARSAAMVTLSQ